MFKSGPGRVLVPATLIIGVVGSSLSAANGKIPGRIGSVYLDPLDLSALKETRNLRRTPSTWAPERH